MHPYVWFRAHMVGKLSDRKVISPRFTPSFRMVCSARFRRQNHQWIQSVSLSQLRRLLPLLFFCSSSPAFLSLLAAQKLEAMWRRVGMQRRSQRHIRRERWVCEASTQRTPIRYDRECTHLDMKMKFVVIHKPFHEGNYIRLSLVKFVHHEYHLQVIHPKHPLEINLLKGHTEEVTGIAISEDGRGLATGTDIWRI